MANRGSLVLSLLIYTAVAAFLVWKKLSNPQPAPELEHKL